MAGIVNYGFCEKIWMIVVFVNRSHTHVLQNTTLFTSLFDMVGGVNEVACSKFILPGVYS